MGWAWISGRGDPAGCRGGSELGEGGGGHRQGDAHAGCDFSLRKVALGTCDRPYGTPCQHENACVRCPMLRLDLAQEPRLLEIEANTRQRLGEAQRMQWLGEAAGLQENLRHIADKKRQAERLRAQTDRGEDGVAALG